MLSENDPASLEIAETRCPGEQRKTSTQFAGSGVPYVAPCLLCHQKRTCALYAAMSALGQKRTCLWSLDGYRGGWRDENGRYWIRWCFVDPKLAEAFAAEFAAFTLKK